MADMEKIEFEMVEAGAAPSDKHNAGISIVSPEAARLILGQDSMRAADAGETLVTVTNALEYIQERTYNRYRPGRFRDFLRVTRDVPEWADQVKYEVYGGYAQWQPGKEDGASMPGAEIFKTDQFFKVKDFWSSYHYTRKELLQAAKAGIQLQEGRSQAVFRGAEQTLEEIAANGHAGTGLGGLRGITGFTVATARAKTGGGTTWVSATQPGYEWIDDMITLEQAVVNGSKETSTPDTAIIPLARLQMLQAQRNTTTDRRMISLLFENLTYIKRVIGWSKLDTTGEAYAFDSQDEEVLQYVIPVEPRQMDPLVQPMGSVRIPCMMTVGGVISKMPKGLAKMTGI
jgi:hypothetical protein